MPYTDLSSTSPPESAVSINSTGVAAIKDPWYSAIYEGTIRHRRFTPRSHAFTYRVFMVYLDLQEIQPIFQQTPWWSSRYFSLAWFRRKDFFDGDATSCLYDSVANYVEQQTGRRPSGAIRMLTNLRYFGFLINPITCYYCFDKTGQQLETVVAEVTNTPWGQRRHYILDLRAKNKTENKGYCAEESKKSSNHKMQSAPVLFKKTMHVSPFQPMNLIYGWRGKAPQEQLAIHLDVFSDDEENHSDKASVVHQKSCEVYKNVASARPVFDATLLLTRVPMTTQEMHKKIRRYPFMTVKVFAAIYWQAIKLWCKKIPFYGAPTHKPN